VEGADQTEKVAVKLGVLGHLFTKANRIVLVSEDVVYMAAVQAVCDLLPNSLSLIVQRPLGDADRQEESGRRIDRPDDVYLCEFDPKRSALRRRKEATHRLQIQVIEVLEEFLEKRSAGNGQSPTLWMRGEWESNFLAYLKPQLSPDASLAFSTPEHFSDLLSQLGWTSQVWEEKMMALQAWRKPGWVQDVTYRQVQSLPNDRSKDPTAKPADVDIIRDAIPSFPASASGTEWEVLFVALLAAVELLTPDDRKSLTITRPDGTERLDESRLVKMARDACRPAGMDSEAGHPSNRDLPGLSRFRHLVRTIDYGIAFDVSGRNPEWARPGTEFLRLTTGWKATCDCPLGGCDCSLETLCRQETERIRTLILWYLLGVEVAAIRRTENKDGLATEDEIVSLATSVIQSNELEKIWLDLDEMRDQVRSSIERLEMPESLSAHANGGSEGDISSELATGNHPGSVALVERHFDPSLTSISPVIAGYFLRLDFDNKGKGRSTPDAQSISNQSLRSQLRAKGLILPSKTVTETVLGVIGKVARDMLSYSEGDKLRVRPWATVFAFDSYELEERNIPRAEIFKMAALVDMVVKKFVDGEVISRSKISQVARSLGPSRRDGPRGIPITPGRGDRIVESPLIGEILEEVARIEDASEAIEFLKKAIGRNALIRFGSEKQIQSLEGRSPENSADAVWLVDELFGHENGVGE
jgi:hypothetical protein